MKRENKNVFRWMIKNNNINIKMPVPDALKYESKLCNTGLCVCNIATRMSTVCQSNVF